MCGCCTSFRIWISLATLSTSATSSKPLVGLKIRLHGLCWNLAENAKMTVCPNQSNGKEETEMQTTKNNQRRFKLIESKTHSTAHKYQMTTTQLRPGQQSSLSPGSLRRPACDFHDHTCNIHPAHRDKQPPLDLTWNSERLSPSRRWGCEFQASPSRRCPLR